MSNPAKAYLATQVKTTTKGELLLMLYEAAIKFLKRAKVEMEKKDYAQKGIYISKAMDVISELANSLNKEKGGEITTNLHSLYMFCNIHLAKANSKMNPDMLDEVIKILDGIRSAFAQIVPSVEKGVTTPGTDKKPTLKKPVLNKKAAPKQKAAAPSAPTKQVAAEQEASPQNSGEQQVKPEQAPVATSPAPEIKSAPGNEPQTTSQPEKTAASKPAPVQQPQPAPPKPLVNPMRLRANNAYTNNR